MSIFNNTITKEVLQKALNKYVGVWIDISEWSVTERTELSNYLEALEYDVWEERDFIPEEINIVHIWGLTAQKYTDCYDSYEKFNRRFKKTPELKWSLKKKTLYSDIWSEHG